MHAITSLWNGLSLKRQLWAVCLLLLIAGLVGIGFSQMTVAATRTAFSTVAETTAPAGSLLVNTDRDAYQAQLATSRLANLAGSEGEARDLQLALFQENADQTLSRFESYQAIALGTPEEVAIWDTYLADREVWLAAVDAVIAAPDVPTAEAAYLEADALFEVMRTHLDVIQEEVYEPAIASLIDVQAADRTASMQQLVAIIAAISLVGLLAAWRFGSSVSGRVDRDSRSVREATTNLVSVSDSLAHSAEETSAMATETAGRADELTGHMQSLAAAVEEMGVSIAEIGRSTTEVSGISTDSVGLVDQALARVGVLTDSSEQIGRVAEVVTAIAEQTNLLALNATIEAARAGDAGRGFAVVAGEVKDLATETATATGEIRALISRIQEDSDQVRQAIAGIHGTIEKVNDLQTSVASAVEEQSITTAEIGRTVSYVSDQTTAMTGSIRSVADNATQATRNADTTRRATDSLRAVSSSLGRLVQGARGLTGTSPARHAVADRPFRAEIARTLAAGEADPYHQDHRAPADIS